MKILVLTTFFLPIMASAQGMPTLVDLVSANAGEGIGGYINTLYAMSIGVAALLAVIKIIIAGVKYMVTDVVPAKGNALSDIRGALLGLLLILSAVLILGEINPDLENNTITFEKIPPPPSAKKSPIESTNPPPPPGTPPPSTPPPPGTPPPSTCDPNTKGPTRTNGFVIYTQNLNNCTNAERSQYLADFARECKRLGGSSVIGAGRPNEWECRISEK